MTPIAANFRPMGAAPHKITGSTCQRAILKKSPISQAPVRAYSEARARCSRNLCCVLLRRSSSMRTDMLEDWREPRSRGVVARRVTVLARPLLAVAGPSPPRSNYHMVVDGGTRCKLRHFDRLRPERRQG